MGISWAYSSVGGPNQRVTPRLFPEPIQYHRSIVSPSLKDLICHLFQRPCSSPEDIGISLRNVSWTFHPLQRVLGSAIISTGQKANYLNILVTLCDVHICQPYTSYTQSPPECSSNPHSPIQLTAFRQLMVAVPPPPHGHRESVALPSAAKYRDLRQNTSMPHAVQNIGKSWPAAFRLSQMSKSNYIEPTYRVLRCISLTFFVHVPTAPHRSSRPRHPSRLTRLSSRGGESRESRSLRDRRCNFRENWH